MVDHEDTKIGLEPTLANGMGATLPLEGEGETLMPGGERPPDETLTLERLAKLAAQSNTQVRYEVTGEAGRGGMGAVLKVFDADLRRTLAMKVILGPGVEPDGSTDVGAGVLSRFLEEAQVTGQLDHPGVVPVHELGVDAEGRAYYTMPLVQGQELKAVIQQVHVEGTEWSMTRAVGVMLKVCEAMSYAHDKGVVHRDLKPANVMVGDYGEVYVMDWGLARVLGEADGTAPKAQASDQRTPTRVRTDRKDSATTAPGSGLNTMDGAVMGTPCYMAPEQALGQIENVGPHSDVYALGAMLYHLLTGSMPYVAAGERTTAQEVLKRARKGPPAKVFSLAPKVPAELVSICERAMARLPQERYSSMGALADDLRSFLENRVVQAHATGPVAELRKWVQRNRALAITGAVSLVAIVGGSIASSVIYRDQRDLANEAERRAGVQTRIAQEAGELAVREQDRARLRLAQAHSLAGVNLLVAGDSSGAALWFAESLGASTGDPELEKRQRRRLAWELASSPRPVMMAQEDDTAVASQISPDGTRMLSNHDRAGCVLWNVEDGSELARFPGATGTLSPDGALVALARRNHGTEEDDGWRSDLACADGVTGDLMGPWGEVLGLAEVQGFVQGASRFLVKLQMPDNQIQAVKLWDGSEGAAANQGVLLVTIGNDLEITADGEWAAVQGSGYGKSQDLVLFRPLEGRVVQRISHTDYIRHIALAPDGRTVATAYGAKARVWNTATGKPFSLELDHGDDIEFLRYDSELGLVLCGSILPEDTGYRVQVWDVTPGADREPAEWTKSDDVQRLELVPGGDGVLALTVHSSDSGETFQAAQIFDVQSGEERHLGFVRTPTMDRIQWKGFQADGAFLTTYGEGSMVEEGATLSVTRWEPRGGMMDTRTFHLGDMQGELDLTASGLRAVVTDNYTSSDSTKTPAATVFDLQSSESVTFSIPEERKLFGIALSPNGERLAAGSDDHRLWMYDSASGLPVGEPMEFDGNVFRTAFSPDGTQLMGGGRDNTARFFDASSGASLGEPVEHPDAVDKLGYVASGDLAWTLCRDGSMRLIDPMTFQVLETFGNGAPKVSLDATPNGELVLLVSERSSGTILLDIPSKTALLRLPDGSYDQRCGAISPDGRWIVTAGGDSLAGHVSVYSAVDGEQRGRSMVHDAAVVFVDFGRNGELIASADWDGTVQLWDAANGEPAAPAMTHEGTLRCCKFSPEGDLIAAGYEDGSVLVWSTSSGELLLAPLALRDDFDGPLAVKALEFSQDGNRLVALSKDGQALEAWSLGAAARSATSLLLEAEIHSGRRVNPMGSLSRLNEVELAERIGRLRAIRDSENR